MCGSDVCLLVFMPLCNPSSLSMGRFSWFASNEQNMAKVRECCFQDWVTQDWRPAGFDEASCHCGKVRTRGQTLANDELETEEVSPTACTELEFCQQPYGLESGSFCSRDSVKTPALAERLYVSFVSPRSWGLSWAVPGFLTHSNYEITNVCCLKPLQACDTVRDDEYTEFASCLYH